MACHATSPPDVYCDPVASAPYPKTVYLKPSPLAISRSWPSEGVLRSGDAVSVRGDHRGQPTSVEIENILVPKRVQEVPELKQRQTAA